LHDISRHGYGRGALVLLLALLALCPPARAGGEPTVREMTDDPVAIARADLAERLGAAPETIELIEQSEVTWRDGSLGCPQPGMAYTQALVNGSRIVLRHGGVDYHYHSGRGRPPFYCADPQAPLPSDAGGLSDR
jgi:hypothetical protein